MDMEENKNEDFSVDREIPIEKGKKSKGSAFAVIIALSLVLSITLSSFVTVYVMSMGFFNPLGLSLANWQKLKWGFKAVDELYYEEADEDRLVDGALVGISTALDEYSLYMPKDNAEEFKKSVDADSYCGVGLYIYSDTESNQVKVLTSINDSPAKGAGIQTGDTIKAVDGQEVGNDVDKASELMLGEAGTKVVVTVIKADSGKTVEIPLKRAEIKLETVFSEKIENNIGYIEISQFGINTYSEFVDHFNKLSQDDMDKLIIDLRSNPGGYLTGALNIADIFLEKDEVIICTKDKKGHTDEYRASGERVDVDIVILCDGGTASASEVVIGALRDNGRAKLIGTKTFGKGVTQAVIEYYDGSAFKITDTTYYTPSGECIDKKGINPDIVVEYGEGEDMQLKAAIKELSQ